MGLDFLISGLIASMIMNHKEKKQTNSLQSTYNNRSAISEKLFVNSRNKKVYVTYKAVKLEWFDNSHCCPSLLPLNIMNKDEIDTLYYYYSILNSNPNSIENRTALVHYLFVLWKDKYKAEIAELLQNELIYIIDYYPAYTQQEIMYKHLAMFLSSECYFFNGDFTNALKRLYQVIDWQAIYENVEDEDGWDSNGLANIHVSAVSNIINIYALVGLPDKTDEVRKAFSLVISDAIKMNNSIKQSNSEAGFVKFLDDCSAMIMAKDNLLGYYLFNADCSNENFFISSWIPTTCGVALYSIDTLPWRPHEISVEKLEGIYDDIPGEYACLCFKGAREIVNYTESIKRCYNDIASI